MKKINPEIQKKRHALGLDRVSSLYASRLFPSKGYALTIQDASTLKRAKSTYEASNSFQKTPEGFLATTFQYETIGGDVNQMFRVGSFAHVCGANSQKFFVSIGQDSNQSLAKLIGIYKGTVLIYLFSTFKTFRCEVGR